MEGAIVGTLSTLLLRLWFLLAPFKRRPKPDPESEIRRRIQEVHEQTRLLELQRTLEAAEQEHQRLLFREPLDPDWEAVEQEERERLRADFDAHSLSRHAEIKAQLAQQMDRQHYAAGLAAQMHRPGAVPHVGRNPFGHLLGGL